MELVLLLLLLVLLERPQLQSLHTMLQWLSSSFFLWRYPSPRATRRTAASHRLLPQQMHPRWRSIVVWTPLPQDEADEQPPTIMQSKFLHRLQGQNAHLLGDKGSSMPVSMKFQAVQIPFQIGKIACPNYGLKLFHLLHPSLSLLLHRSLSIYTYESYVCSVFSWSREPI